MIYQLRSERSLIEIETALTESAARNQFGVIAVHDLQETMRKKGVDRVLECDGAISTALPCRISVYSSMCSPPCYRLR